MSFAVKFLHLYRRRHSLAALFAFVVIVGALHWPLLANLSTHVIGRPFDDVFGILWGLDWAKRAIFELKTSPFFMPDVFYPHGFYLSSSSPPIWWFVVFSPLTQLLGPVVTYNVLSLSIYILAAIGMYLLVSHLGGRWLSAILAGCIYISAPIFSIRLGGHIDILLSSLWLPYLALFSHKAAQSNKAKYWLPAGFFFGAAILGHWQFVFLAPLIPVTIIGLEPSGYNLRQRIILVIKIGLIALMFVSPFLTLTLYSRSQMYHEVASFSITSANFYSLSLERLFVPNPLSSIWGEWSRATFPVTSEASIVSIGYMNIVLVLIGMFFNWPRRKIYLVLLSLCLIGAMGIVLKWNGESVIVPVPATLSDTMRAMVETVVGPNLMPPGEAIVVPMPLALFYSILPIMTLTRVWARFMIPGMLAIGVIASFGASKLARHVPNGSRFVLLFIISAVLLEGYMVPYQDFTEVSDNHRLVDEWLASQEVPVALIEFPFPSANKLAMYRQSIHRQRIVNGYASIAPSHLSEAAIGLWPDDQSIDMMRSWNIEYVLVNGNFNMSFQEDVLPAIQGVDGLCLIRVDDEPKHNRQTLLFRIMYDKQTCP